MQKGRGTYAGMDDCHARDYRFVNLAGHGKNYFVKPTVQGRRCDAAVRKSSAERKSWAICAVISETGGYLLWNAISEGLSKCRAGGLGFLPGQRKNLFKMLSERFLLGWAEKWDVRRCVFSDPGHWGWAGGENSKNESWLDGTVCQSWTVLWGSQTVFSEGKTESGVE